MIPRRGEGRGQTAEHALSVMVHRAELAMHDFACPHDPAAESLPDGLMTKADAHQRNPGFGGGANADVMAGALEVINFDDKVRSILINIFGGITRGEEVAKGIVEAMGRVELRAPIVIRLDGTNAEEGRRILLDAGIPADKLQSEPTMLDAARAAVAKAK